MLTDAYKAATGVAPRPAPVLTVETVSDFQSFLDLEPIWNPLVEEAGLAHPFVTHEWVRTWWESFGAGRQLHVLVVRDGLAPIAIAPLMLSRERIYGMPVRRLGIIANVHSPRTEFIIAGRPAEACAAIWRHLAAESRQWDVMELCQIPPESCLLEELPRLAASDGFLTGQWNAGDSPYLPLAGAWASWEAYHASLDRKHRYNLRNRLKRLSALGPVQLETVSAPEQVQEAVEEGFRIEAAAWKGEAGTAMGGRPELRQFYTTIAHRLAGRGWLRLHFLTVKGRRIAFGYSVCRDNRLYLIKPGYLPDFAQYSPCNLMCALVLQDAFAAGIEEYDFLGIADAWKLEWTPLARRHTWLYLFAPQWRMRLLHWLKFSLVHRLQRHPWYGRLRNAVVDRIGRGS